ncbi:MAG: calcium/sodium antiporter [Ruminococcus sp.]
MQNIINGLPIAAVILLLAVGFAFLVKGADFFVEGSSSIAKKLKVPPIIIGLTIVAMGTSLPETAVSVTASLVQNNELAVSNVVGSNIFNLMFVIGVCSILTPIMVQKATVVRDIPLSLGCALFLLVLGISGLGDKTGMTLGHADGVIFLIVFAGYIFTMVRSAMKARAAGQKVEIEGVEECDNMKELSYGKSILFLIVGAAAIAFGGDLTVDTASRIAIELGMSQTLVGLTIVSIGTSLPELVTSVVAARKNEVDMAVGNAVGSNIFNILMVLGISSAISPVALIWENIIDIVLLMVFSVMVWIFAGTRKKIERKEGIIMVVVYLVYCAYIIAR